MGETTDRLVTDAELTRLLAARDEASPGDWTEDGGHLFASEGEGTAAELANFHLKEDAIFCELAHEWMPDVVAALLEARAVLLETAQSPFAFSDIVALKGAASNPASPRRKIPLFTEGYVALARRILHALGETTEKGAITNESKAEN
jgi:hypothetical protein